MEKRLFEDTHPWLTFKVDLLPIGSLTWAQLGECYSKCQHLIGTPLKPMMAARLAQIYLRRGALASAAIEGNTLNEAEMSQVLDKKKKLPESQQYLEQEIVNILKALDGVKDSSHSGKKFQLTRQWILEVHAQLLENLDTPDHVVPGETRKVSVVVGPYKGPPVEDVNYLLDQLCDWLNQMLAARDGLTEKSPDQAFFHTFFIAILTHLYIAWIHPFGDGNGRTARVLECAIFEHSGLVPWISTNLLSDYYNRTRGRYYEKLEASSKGNDITGFIAYSAIGFRDQLREQISVVQQEQKKVAWINYVHEVFNKHPSKTGSRQRDLLLAMPNYQILTSDEMRILTKAIAASYSTAHEKTFKRDVNMLLELGLIEQVEKGKYQVLIDQMDAFTPRPENSTETRAAKIK
jgi:Fic family protein